MRKWKKLDRELWDNYGDFFIGAGLVLFGVIMGALLLYGYLIYRESAFDTAEVKIVEGFTGNITSLDGFDLYIRLGEVSFKEEILSGEKLSVFPLSNKRAILTWYTKDPFELYVDRLDKGTGFQIKLGEEVLADGVFRGRPAAIYLGKLEKNPDVFREEKDVWLTKIKTLGTYLGFSMLGSESGVTEESGSSTVSSGSEITGTETFSGPFYLPIIDPHILEK